MRTKLTLLAIGLAAMFAAAPTQPPSTKVVEQPGRRPSLLRREASQRPRFDPMPSWRGTRTPARQPLPPASLPSTTRSTNRICTP